MRRSFVLVYVALLAAACALAEETKSLHQVIPAAAGQTLVFENLAGRVTVSPSADGSLTIDGTVHAESRELLDAVSLDVSKDASRSVARVLYPVDRHETFHYPDPQRDGERGGFWKSFDYSQSKFEYQGRRVTVTSGNRRGVLLYTDITVRVPTGVSVELSNHVGRVESRDLTGSLRVSTSSGDVHIRDNGGAVRAATGSGDVRVDGGKAGVRVTTGSGDVEVLRATDVTAETGSGDVHLVDVAGAVKARTGSGGVALDRVDGSLELGTGSGDVTARRLTLKGKLDVETGSGDVQLAGDMAGLSQATIEVSSGSVSWRLSGAPALDLRVSTSSGSIDVDLPGLTFTKKKERRVEASSGAGGVPVRITTSSGDVSLRS